MQVGTRSISPRSLSRPSNETRQNQDEQLTRTVSQETHLAALVSSENEVTPIVGNNYVKQEPFCSLKFAEEYQKQVGLFGINSMFKGRQNVTFEEAVQHASSHPGGTTDRTLIAMGHNVQEFRRNEQDFSRFRDNPIIKEYEELAKNIRGIKAMFESLDPGGKK